MSKLDDLVERLRQEDALLQDAIAQLILQVTQLIARLEVTEEKPADLATVVPDDDPYGEYWGLFGDMSPDIAQRIFNDWLARNAGDEYAPDDDAGKPIEYHSMFTDSEYRTVQTQLAKKRATA